MELARAGKGSAKRPASTRLVRRTFRGSLQQPFTEFQKALHIVEIGQHPDRDAHRAAGFPIDAVAEIIQRQALFVAGAVETDVQFQARDAQRQLARAGVAETARAERNVDLVGFFFDGAMVNRPAILIEKVDCDRPAARLRGRGAIDLDEWDAGAVLHRR
jgi:hypothetical protein